MGHPASSQGVHPLNAVTRHMLDMYPSRTNILCTIFISVYYMEIDLLVLMRPSDR